MWQQLMLLGILPIQPCNLENAHLSQTSQTCVFVWPRGWTAELACHRCLLPPAEFHLTFALSYRYHTTSAKRKKPSLSSLLQQTANIKSGSWDGAHHKNQRRIQLHLGRCREHERPSNSLSWTYRPKDLLFKIKKMLRTLHFPTLSQRVPVQTILSARSCMWRSRPMQITFRGSAGPPPYLKAEPRPGGTWRDLEQLSTSHNFPKGWEDQTAVKRICLITN